MNVGSATRSLGQLLENTCANYRGFSVVVIKLWNVLDEVKGIFAEDDVKNIVTKLRQFRGINVVSWKKYYELQMCSFNINCFDIIQSDFMIRRASALFNLNLIKQNLVE